MKRFATWLKSPLKHPANSANGLMKPLNDKDPRPSDATLDILARNLQIALNRANNARAERAGSVPLSKLKDVSPAEYCDSR